LQDRARQPRIGVHQPFTLPALADERRDDLINEGAAARARDALLLREPPIDHVHGLRPPMPTPSSRHLLPLSSAERAPEQAVGRMPGGSPGMTCACPLSSAQAIAALVNWRYW